MSRSISPSYKTKNWSVYDEALKQRGSLDLPPQNWAIQNESLFL